MKKMRKIVSFLLAMVMVLAMSITTMAADAGDTVLDTDTGTITVVNPQEGESYTAYKIFDVEYSADKSSYLYTIGTKSVWYDTVSGYAEGLDTDGTTKKNGITLSESEEKSTESETFYVVETNDDFSAANFANELKSALEGFDEELETGGVVLETSSEDSTQVVATGLPLGYYFVSSISGALCNLTTTNNEVTIRDKNGVTFDKVDNVVTADIGTKVKYTITGKVPDTTGFNEYTYTIEDTLSVGLTMDENSIDIKINGETPSDDVISANYTLETKEATPETGGGFTLTIPVMEYRDLVGKEIVVTYEATVNANASGTVQNNTATLTYSNNPTEATATKTTIPDIEKVYSAKIDITKVDEAGKTLSGAVFVLKRTEKADGTQEEKYYKFAEATDTTPATVTWVDTQDEATRITTGADGKAVFNGLADGTYEVVEIEAPKGYNLLATPIEVKIEGDAYNKNLSVDEGGKGDDTSLLIKTENVENKSGTRLPSTGGIGTTIFYIIGGLLVFIAIVVLIARKRMDMEEK